MLTSVPDPGVDDEIFLDEPYYLSGGAPSRRFSTQSGRASPPAQSDCGIGARQGGVRQRDHGDRQPSALDEDVRHGRSGDDLGAERPDRELATLGLVPGDFAESPLDPGNERA